MQAEQVTFFAGVPTMYHALLHCEQTGRLDIAKIADRMRVAVSGGAALPAEVMRRFEQRFGVPILEGYGLSETSPVATFNRTDRPRSSARLACPSGASRSGSSPTTGRTLRTASRGRSRSAATT
jgi:long-chain acyl-CoA synthetase